MLDEVGERRLVKAVARYYYDPLGFVLFDFPWRKPGALLIHDGPDVWQRAVLKVLGEQLRARAKLGSDQEAKLISTALRLAVSSGHGVGKTALVAWIILWFISTRPHPQIVVTANTSTQLKTKTWRELAKWHKLAVNRHWFEWTATSFKLKSSPETWFASAIPWSAANPTAFAGTHEKHVLMLFDEASEIDDIIWDTAEGALTTGAKEGYTTIWIAFGNPTLNTGRFRQCWTKFRKRWITMQVDSRQAKMADKRQMQEWIEDFGEDSDFVRVRVKGMFPRVGATQFISNEVVELAQRRSVEEKWIPRGTPKLMGVDVARQGDDQSVIILRHGRKMKKDIFRYRIPDLMLLAGHVSGKIKEWKPDIVFVDATGMGSGVYDRLVQLQHDNVVACWAGDRGLTMENHIYYNPRIEWWARLREWLKTGDIPEDSELYEDLIGPEFLYDVGMLMRLERKEDMKKRGLPSPDTGDALALTFAQPVPVKTSYTEADLEPEVA